MGDARPNMVRQSLAVMLAVPQASSVWASTLRVWACRACGWLPLRGLLPGRLIRASLCPYRCARVARACTCCLGRWRRLCAVGAFGVCLRTAFLRRHSPCFVWIFREDPRGAQTGREARGGGARVHHSPGLKVVRGAQGFGCARACACARLSCGLRVGRHDGGGCRGCVESRGGARRSNLLAALARRPLFLPLEQGC
jgi:hypothetical protein